MSRDSILPNAAVPLRIAIYSNGRRSNDCLPLAHCEGIVSKKPRPKNAYDFIGLFYCFTVQLYGCVVPLPT